MLFFFSCLRREWVILHRSIWLETIENAGVQMVLVVRVMWIEIMAIFFFIRPTHTFLSETTWKLSSVLTVCFYEERKKEWERALISLHRSKEKFHNSRLHNLSFTEQSPLNQMKMREKKESKVRSIVKKKK